MAALRCTSTTNALFLAAATCAAAACAAVIGVDGDFVEESGGVAGAGAAGGSSGGAAGSVASGGSTSSTTGPTGGAGGSVQPNGAPCAAPEQCESERCVDGICCAQDCDQLCRSCALPDHAGECTRIPEGQNPDADCSDEDLQACDGDDHCKGLEGAVCEENRDCLSDDCDGDSHTCNAP